MSSFCNLGKPGVPSVNITFDQRNTNLPITQRHPVCELFREYHGQTDDTDQSLIFVYGWHGLTPLGNSRHGLTDLGTEDLSADGRMSDTLSIISAPEDEVLTLAALLVTDSLRFEQQIPVGSRWVPGTNGRTKPRGCGVLEGKLHHHLAPRNVLVDQFRLGIFVAHSLSAEVISYRHSTIARARENPDHKLRKLLFSLRGTGGAYGVMQRRLPLLHADLRTGIVEQVRVRDGTLHVYTDLMPPAMRANVLELQRQEFLGAGLARAAAIAADAAQEAATLQLASREGGGVERGEEGGRDDAAGHAHMRAAAGLTARSDTDVIDSESESDVTPRGRSARIAGTVATAERAHGVASRTRRRSAGPERNSGARPRLARRVIIHRAPNGAPLCARLSPDNRGEGFIALSDSESESDEACYYAHSIADCFATALAPSEHFQHSDLEELFSDISSDSG